MHIVFSRRFTGPQGDGQRFVRLATHFREATHWRARSGWFPLALLTMNR